MPEVGTFSQRYQAEENAPFLFQYGLVLLREEYRRLWHWVMEYRLTNPLRLE